ncbi:MAG: hypothetical protein R3A79_19895, partial [Nannocystaceae bacterium]
MDPRTRILLRIGRALGLTLAVGASASCNEKLDESSEATTSATEATSTTSTTSTTAELTSQGVVSDDSNGVGGNCSPPHKSELCRPLMPGGTTSDTGGETTGDATTTGDTATTGDTTGDTDGTGTDTDTTGDTTGDATTGD